MHGSFLPCLAIQPLVYQLLISIYGGCLEVQSYEETSIALVATVIRLIPLVFENGLNARHPGQGETPLKIFGPKSSDLKICKELHINKYNFSWK